MLKPFLGIVVAAVMLSAMPAQAAKGNSAQKTTFFAKLDERSSVAANAAACGEDVQTVVESLEYTRQWAMRKVDDYEKLQEYMLKRWELDISLAMRAKRLDPNSCEKAVLAYKVKPVSWWRYP